MCILNSELIKKLLELFIFSPNFTNIKRGYKCDPIFTFLSKSYGQSYLFWTNLTWSNTQ